MYEVASVKYGLDSFSTAPKVTLGQIKIFYANIGEMHQKFRINASVIMLSPLRLLA